MWLDTWARMLSASGGHDSDPEHRWSGDPWLRSDSRRTRLYGHDRSPHRMVAGCAGAAEGTVDELPGAIDGATCCKKDGEGAAAWFRFKSVYQRHAADGFEQVAKLEEFGPIGFS